MSLVWAPPGKVSPMTRAGAPPVWLVPVGGPNVVCRPVFDVSGLIAEPAVAAPVTLPARTRLDWLTRVGSSCDGSTGCSLVDAAARFSSSVIGAGPLAHLLLSKTGPPCSERRARNARPPRILTPGRPVALARLVPNFARFGAALTPRCRWCVKETVRLGRPTNGGFTAPAKMFIIEALAASFWQESDHVFR